MESLANDHLYQILKYSEIWDIFNNKLVCKQFNDVLELNIIWDYFLNRDYYGPIVRNHRLTKHEDFDKLIHEYNFKKIYKQLYELYLVSDLYDGRSINTLLNLNRVDLEGRDILKIKQGICNLTNLTILELSYNKIKSVPSTIGNLTNLIYLYLNNNEIKNIPQEIKYLTKLSRLLLSYNNIETIPSEIKYLTSLTTLSISHNKLKATPIEINELVNLKTLYICGYEKTIFNEINMSNIDEIYVSRGFYTTELTKIYGKKIIHS